MTSKIKNHLEKIKYLWKDNKIMMFKHIYNIFYCGIVKIPNYFKRKSEHKRFLEITQGKKEIIYDLFYSPTIKSKIILPTKDEGLSKDLILNSMREPTEVGLIIKEIKDGMNIIDIGANLGIYLLLESHLTKGKVYGIEPNYNAFKFLQRSVKLNGFKNVELFNMGISDKKDTIPFYISKKWNWSRFKRSHNPTGINNTEEMDDIIKVKQIPINSLDNMFKNKKIDIIRMDVEGHEIHILKGAENLIKNNPAIKIFVEYHPDMFNTNERMEFINWIEKNKLKIKYFLGSSKFKISKIKENITLKRLRNLSGNYCLVLESEKEDKSKR